MTTRLNGKSKNIPIKGLEIWKEGNVRKHEIYEGIGELAKNIKSNGLHVPIVVFYDEKKKKHLIISGQRRFKACDMVNYDPIECIVIKKPTLEQARILSLSENMYRRSMTPNDISDACDYLYKKLKKIKDVADKLGVSTSTVRRYLGYQKVPKEIKKLVKEKKISASQALGIYTQFPDKTKQLKIARELARITDRVDKSKFYEAVKDSPPNESSSKLKERAKKKKASEKYEIYIPNKTSEVVKKSAKEMDVEKEFVVVDIIEKWVQQHNATGRGVLE